MRRIAVVITVLLAICMNATAQNNTSDGAFCVKTFEDVNGNGVWDTNEVELRGGISANLLDENNIVIASALLDNASLAPGVICFQNLAEGQYSIEIFSADYRATTATTMTNFVNAGQVPFVMEVGAQSISTTTTTVSNNASIPAVDNEAAVLRIVVALTGAAVVVVFMSFVGFLIYLIGYRGRLKRAEAMPIDDYYRRPPTTGSMPRVTDTGEYRPPKQ